MPDPTCTGCLGTSTDGSHTCRELGWPPVRTYGCTVQAVNDADTESREAFRQLMWAGYDMLNAKKGEA